MSGHDEPDEPPMRRVTVYVSTNKIGSGCELEIEVEPDCTDEEIDEMARDAMFGMIEWGWK